MRETQVVYAGYLNFIYGTIKGLSSWNPETKVMPCHGESVSDYYIANL